MKMTLASLVAAYVISQKGGISLEHLTENVKNTQNYNKYCLVLCVLPYMFPKGSYKAKHVCHQRLS